MSSFQQNLTDNTYPNRVDGQTYLETIFGGGRSDVEDAVLKHLTPTDVMALQKASPLLEQSAALKTFANVPAAESYRTKTVWPRCRCMNYDMYGGQLGLCAARAPGCALHITRCQDKRRNQERHYFCEKHAADGYENELIASARLKIHEVLVPPICHGCSKELEAEHLKLRYQGEAALVSDSTFCQCLRGWKREAEAGWCSDCANEEHAQVQAVFDENHDRMTEQFMRLAMFTGHCRFCDQDFPLDDATLKTHSSLKWCMVCEKPAPGNFASECHLTPVRDIDPTDDHPVAIMIRNFIRGFN